MPSTTTVASETRQRKSKVRPATSIQRLLTLRQASELLGMPERSLNYWVAQGVLACVQFPDSRRIWLDRGDLDAFVANWKRRRG